MQSLLLNGVWELANGRTGDRYQANVPGFVQKDLMDQGVLPNEYDTLFEPKIEWVEHDEWTYRLWQWSDLWPSISWALVDYGKVYKPSYYYMKRSFQTPNAYAKITPGAAEAELYLIHDHGDFVGKLVVEFYDLETDRVVRIDEREVRGKGHRSTPVGTFSAEGLDPATTIVYVHLERDGKRLASNTYLLGKPHQLRSKPAAVTVKEERLANGDTKFTLTADVFAKDAGLADVPGALTDNYFDLRAGESREIVLNGALADGISVKPVCLNQVKTIGYV
ncbi:glycoside hydrolase family 2 protein [Cohnella sp. REN36]|uniref:glycoside hydrolase family 2 protein n=1 Tax=Cohnella sp. REN36 TaxID=2887347 RepID=UPI001D14F358|nr:glycoside hydrolase family 2 protein [Cohnella sp. REN36]MCC3373930.1 hypothetical protein [Cohnella sp. REN36]